MNDNDPQKLIKKARLAHRKAEAGKADLPELPPGLADRVLAGLPDQECAWELRLLERVSYAGAAVAACIAIMVSLPAAEPPDEVPAEAWLEMPMRSDF